MEGNAGPAQEMRDPHSIDHILTESILSDRQQGMKWNRMNVGVQMAKDDGDGMNPACWLVQKWMGDGLSSA